MNADFDYYLLAKENKVFVEEIDRGRRKRARN